MSEHTVKLTSAEINHLYGLLWGRKDSGEYAGNREQYYARTDRLIAKLDRAVAPVSEEGR